MEIISEKDIYTWCTDHGVNVRRSVGLVGNFTNITDEEVIKEVNKLCGIKSPVIIDKWKGTLGETCAVLINNQNNLDASLIPINILVESVPGRRWLVIWPSQVVVGEEEATEVPGYGVEENQRSHQSMGDFSQANQTNTDPIEPQVEAVMDKVVSHFERWHYEGGYRRLRVFSGILPVPTGEESYEVWREAAVQHSEEWRCPEHIKKQRIVESLRGPAMGIIHATRRSNPNATLKDYFTALDYSFGTIEEVGDILSRLHRTFQEPTETLTDYIYRIDKILYKLLDKGGIEQREIDERRMKHVLIGALTSNPVAQRLRCSMPRTPSPTLSDLIK
ncbi:paraneoplastic antigen Ma2-like [Pseudophryne corroboree]|uniref:paraneoplastic antigen Ma2-like n=1 Tax=Pseudophryne corroboree TaxID=495146 RepID=UPI0030820AF6